MLKNLGYTKQDSKSQHTKYINQSFKNTEKTKQKPRQKVHNSKPVKKTNPLPDIMTTDALCKYLKILMLWLTVNYN